MVKRGCHVVSVEDEIEPAPGLAGRDAEQPSGLLESVENRQATGKQGFLKPPGLPHFDPGLGIPLAQGLVAFRRLFRGQHRDRLEQRQADDLEDILAKRRIEVEGAPGALHSGDDGMLTVDQGSVDVEDRQAKSIRAVSHFLPLMNPIFSATAPAAKHRL